MLKVIGHRGAAGHAPENTILSFQKAIDLKCDRAELDVQLSKDGELIVFHDPEVSRVTNGSGFINEMNFKQLRELYLSNNQKIPTLQEVIDLCKGKINLQIELKAPGTPKVVDYILKKNGISEEEVVITSFHQELLKEIKEINPKYELGLLYKQHSEEVWDLAKEIPLQYICPKENVVTQDIVSKAHEMGIIVYVFGVHDQFIGKKVIDLGVDEIGTNFPDLFIKY